MTRTMLTTIDNPYDPFEQFDDWYMFDTQQMYNSCSLLARIARTSEQFSSIENEQEIARAIDEIIKYDFRNIYIKIEKEDNSPDIYTSKEGTGGS